MPVAAKVAEYVVPTVPPAKRPVEIDGATHNGAPTVMLKVPDVAWALGEQLLLTRTLNELVPTAVGVPLMRPVLESESPGGKLLTGKTYVSGPGLPFAVSW